MDFVPTPQWPDIPCEYNGARGYWSCPKCYDYWPAFWTSSGVPIDPCKPIGQQEDYR